MKQITMNEMEEINGGATGCGGWGSVAAAASMVGLWGFAVFCALVYIGCSW